VNLSWTAPADDGGSPITGYRIYRNGSAYDVVGTVGVYTDTGVSPDTPYTYAVAAINAVDEGPLSNSEAVTTPP